MTASRQTTDGEDYESGYEYNLAGALVEQTYPSGRVVRNVLDNNGDLSLVQSKKNSNSGYWNYASSFTYNAAGAVTSMQLGNGRWESTTFNSLLQPTQIALGATPGAMNILDLDYSYGTTANNGSVLSQTITVPGLDHPFIQTYTYDSLNRLTSATETNDSTQTWKQTFTFDRYGNRNFDEANTTFEGFDKLCNNNTELCADLRKKLNPSISTSNNRFSSGQDYGYDSGGNTTVDPYGREFIYDAENKQVKVLDDQDETIGEYFYDGDGRRVKKYIPSTGEVTIFVYDAASKLIAEYSTVVAPENEAKVAYLTNDRLGSPRINTNANGTVTARHDYHPFGEGIVTSQRASGLGYVDDTVRQQFTGYERDNETGLEFAEARMLNSSVGRFGTPDPYNVILEKERGEDEDERSEILVGFISNPQRWNMYVYVVNNPLALMDADGQKPNTINVFVGLANDEGMKEWEAFKAAAEKKGFTVNLYVIEEGKGSAGQFLDSLKAKDTVTIFAGHSYNKLGIFFEQSAIGNSQAKRAGIVSDTADGVDIQNDIVAVFSCGFANGFDDITSSNGAVFVSIVQGPDRTTGGDAVNQAGLRFALSIADSFSSAFTFQSDLDRAVRAAQSGIAAFPQPDPRVNARDRVTPRVLPAPKRKR